MGEEYTQAGLNTELHFNARLHQLGQGIQADLTGADLTALDLRDQDLTNVSLRDANLKDVTIGKSTILKNVDIRGAKNVSSAFIDACIQQNGPEWKTNNVRQHSADEGVFLDPVLDIDEIFGGGGTSSPSSSSQGRGGRPGAGGGRRGR